MNLAGMVTTIAESAANHTFAGGTEWRPTVDKMWLLRAGPNGLYNPQLISTAAWSTFQTIWSNLAQNKINVSAAVAAL
jgi:hypothetical protein